MCRNRTNDFRRLNTMLSNLNILLIMGQIELNKVEKKLENLQKIKIVSQFILLMLLAYLVFNLLYVISNYDETNDYKQEMKQEIRENRGYY